MTSWFLETITHPVAVRHGFRMSIGEKQWITGLRKATRFNEDDRRRIVAEAKANLERLEDCERRFAAERVAKTEASVLLPGEQDTMEHWTNMQPEPDPSPRHRKLDTHSEPNWDGWNNWADQKIARALAVEREAVLTAVAQEISDEREAMGGQLAEEVRSLRIEITALQAVIDELRAVIRAESTKVIDLPNPMRRAN
jgi:hypothetical protein